MGDISSSGITTVLDPGSWRGRVEFTSWCFLLSPEERFDQVSTVAPPFHARKLAISQRSICYINAAKQVSPNTLMQQRVHLLRKANVGLQSGQAAATRQQAMECWRWATVWSICRVSSTVSTHRISRPPNSLSNTRREGGEQPCGSAMKPRQFHVHVTKHRDGNELGDRQVTCVDALLHDSPLGAAEDDHHTVFMCETLGHATIA